MKPQRLREATDSLDREHVDIEPADKAGLRFVEARFSTIREGDGEGNVVNTTTIESIGLDAERSARKLPRGAGAYGSGRSDVSDRAEEFLRLAAAVSR